MKGHPKYKYGQRVLFKICNKSLTGDIYIIDPFGCFNDNSDVCYDILCEDALYKHVNEKLIIKRFNKKRR